MRILEDERVGLKPSYFEINKVIKAIPLLPYEYSIYAMDIITLLNKLGLIEGYGWNYERMNHKKVGQVKDIVLECFRCLSKGFTLNYDDETKTTEFVIDWEQFERFKSLLNKINNDEDTVTKINKAITQVKSTTSPRAKGKQLPDGWMLTIYNYLDNNPSATIIACMETLNKEHGTKIDSDAKKAYAEIKEFYGNYLK